MKIIDRYDHLRGLQNVKYKKGIYDEINDILDIDNVKFGTTPPSKIKKIVRARFNEYGWADNVKIADSKLTVSYVKSKIGICFQIGNVARTYADILKLSKLYKIGVIDAGIIIVPDNPESKKMGTNYANYNRLVKELELFKDIVTIPILIIALSNID